MSKGRIFRSVKQVLEAYNVPRTLTWDEKLQKLLDNFRAAIREEKDDANS